MKDIGGYFGLELSQGTEYHSSALRLNSGRNALRYILETRRYNKLYIPVYGCQALYQPLQKLGIEYQCYNIDHLLEPVFDFNLVAENEAFLYVNYFGIKDSFVEHLAGGQANIIIDNCQSFYSQPISGCDVFYSPRKFFGVPDGAYLYLGQGPSELRPLPNDYSHERCTHLLERLDLSPEEGYTAFLASENLMNQLDVKTISALTRRILESIDYHKIYEIRRKNYSILHKAFAAINEFSAPDMDATTGSPLVYPFVIRKEGLRERLIQERIFVARYWPDVLERVSKESLEYYLAKYLIPLPVDQRYNEEDMHALINLMGQLL